MRGGRGVKGWIHRVGVYVLMIVDDNCTAKFEIAFNGDSRNSHRCWDEGRRLRLERRKGCLAALGRLSGLEGFRVVDLVEGSDMGVGGRIDDEGRASNGFDGGSSKWRRGMISVISRPASRITPARGDIGANPISFWIPRVGEDVWCATPLFSDVS